MLSIISVAKQPCVDFDKTAQSVFEEFSSRSEVEYLIQEYPSDHPSIAECLKRLSLKHPGGFSLRHIQEVDAGVFHAMNKAWHNSSGDWILFLNAGDWLQKGIGIRLLGDLEQHPKADFLYFDGLSGEHPNHRSARRQAPDRMTFSDFLHKVPVLHPCVCIRRRPLETWNHQILEHGPFDETFVYAADFDLLLRMVCAGLHGVHIPIIAAGMSFGGLSDRHRFKAKREALRSLLTHSTGIACTIKVFAAWLQFCAKYGARSLVTTLQSK